MRKIILFIFIMICTILLLLFVCVKNVNYDEELYALPIPPDIQLTDGINSITGSVKMDNWYYRGKDNKFYRYQNNSAANGDDIDNAVDKDYINDSVINNSAVNDKDYIISKTQDFSNNLDDINNQEVLCYNENLALNFSYSSDKYSQYHYPDKLDLQIFHKDNLIFQDQDLQIHV
jgi:hypothetical protein